MTVRVGPKGQVVLPKPVRDALGIRPGDEVVVEQAGEEARIRRLGSPSGLRGLLRTGATTADLEAERRKERKREAPRGRQR